MKLTSQHLSKRLITQIYSPFYSNNEAIFTHPLRVRKWLKLLTNDSISAIRIKPSLKINKSIMGFSFSSNNHGLRGPTNKYGSTVIFGTSFAMGFAVNNGENWYDQIKFLQDDSINLGLPTGIEQMQNLYQHLYKGSHSRAIVLYHPNFWPLGYLYYNLKDRNVFEHFKWETRYLQCFFKTYQKQKELRRYADKDEIKFLTTNTTPIILNSRYASFDFNKHPEFVNRYIEIWRTMLNNFKSIYIFRLPAKEEAVYYEYNLCWPELKHRIAHYSKGWDLFINGLQNNKIKNFRLHKKFTSDHYLPLDTHWSSAGNKFFSSLANSLLD